MTFKLQKRTDVWYSTETDPEKGVWLCTEGIKAVFRTESLPKHITIEIGQKKTIRRNKKIILTLTDYADGIVVNNGRILDVSTSENIVDKVGLTGNKREVTFWGRLIQHKK